MMKPLVCICIPTYNAEKTIAETLESILAQTYSNVEIHIFDNASTDCTVELVTELGKTIQIHKVQSTSTGEENFTRCLNLGRGEYTAIYHADDLYAPTIIEKEVKFLEENKNAKGVLTFATQIDAEGKELKMYLAPESLGLAAGEANVYGIETLLKAVLENDNFLFCPSAMIRTNVCINDIKYWKGNLFKSSADLDVWFRLANLGGIGLLNEPLLLYRISSKQWTATYRKKRKVRADTFLVLDAWLGKENIKQSIEKKDVAHYQKLQHHDVLGCMLNAVRDNEIEFARNIWFNEPSFSIIKELLQVESRRDFKFLALSQALKIMLVPLVGQPLRYVFRKYLDKVRL